MKFFSLFLLSILGFNSAKCQMQEIRLIDEYQNTTGNDSIKSINLNSFLFDLKQNYVEQGYLGFSIDSLEQLESHLNIHIYKGKLYLHHNSTDENYKHNVFNSNEIEQSINSDLIKLENTGYPFAKITIYNSKIKDSIIEFNTKTNRNQLTTIDSLVIKSNTKIDSRLIQKITKISTQQDYNEKLIKQIPELIDKSKYYKSTKKTEALFTDQGTQLYLYLEKLTTNRFEGILGIQPNNNNQKTSVTGEINTRFDNNFQRGETFSFEWKKLPSQTQELKINASYPYIGFSDIGVLGNLDIYKQDSTFIATNKAIGVSYRMSLSEQISVFYENNNSFDQTNLNETEFSNSKSNAFGIKYYKNNFNRNINPTQGYSFSISHSVGTRNTILNDEKQETSQHRSKIEIQKIIKLFNRINVLAKAQEQFQTGGSQFENELIRFGGLNSLRGFDEMSFRATTFITSSIELRYLLDSNSNFHIFGDLAWYEQNTATAYFNDLPYGIGAGISFTTKTGIFSFDYALGRQFNNPIDFRTGKIHFGIKNLF